MKRSNKAPDKVIGTSRAGHRFFEPVLVALEKKFPKKCAQELALRAKRSERVCEIWIARRGTPDGGALACLIDSDVGDIVMLALTKNSKQPWVKALRRHHEIASLRTVQVEAARRLAALELGAE